MKLRYILPIGLTVAVFASVEATATTIDWNDGYRTGNGGEFTLVDTGLDLGAYTSDTSGIIGDDSFQTFCIEYNEYISKGQTVDFALSSAAVEGGANVDAGQPGGNPDPVSLGTAYLYSQFAAGTLVGYDYTLAGRQASAGELQNAIWYLENERTLADIGGANSFVTAVVNMFTAAGAVADAGGAYSVQAVNLTANGGKSLRQDQLYYVGVPDGGSSLALLGLAMGGLALVARRRKA